MSSEVGHITARRRWPLYISPEPGPLYPVNRCSPKTTNGHEVQLLLHESLSLRAVVSPSNRNYISSLTISGRPWQRALIPSRCRKCCSAASRGGRAPRGDCQPPPHGPPKRTESPRAGASRVPRDPSDFDQVRPVPFDLSRAALNPGCSKGVADPDVECSGQAVRSVLVGAANWRTVASGL